MEKGNASKSDASERVLPPRGGADQIGERGVGEMDLVPEAVRDEVEQELASPERGAQEQEGVEMVTPEMPPMPETAIVDIGTVDDENPDTAEDGEKIEREWADRVRKVVEETKDNPRTEQIEVNKLKADYLKKRFNRELGDRN